MPNMNLVVLAGNLTRDPELRTLKSGTTVTKFGMAMNRKYTNKTTGELVSEPTFVDVDFFGRGGEVIAEYLRRGDPILITGRLQFNRWEDSDGRPRSKLSVVGDRFEFVGRRPGGSGERSERTPELAGMGAPGGLTDSEVPF